MLTKKLRLFIFIFVIVLQICFYLFYNQNLFIDIIFQSELQSFTYVKKFEVTYRKDPNANYSFLPVSIKSPIILEWNGFTMQSTFGNPKDYERDCPQKCIYTSDRRLEPIADMITFNMGKFKDVSNVYNPNRLNVFVTFESPEHRPYYLGIPKDYFNVTATYRLDSDIPLSYDYLDPIIDPEEAWDQDYVMKAIEKKNKAALFLVSHCKTTSKRELLVAEMKKYINVTQIGNCNKKYCKKDKKCENENVESHHFTIAFENSDCVDYLTEKVYRLRKLIVPIILDRSILKGKHSRLNPYVIAVNDFNSTKQLTDYLHHLMNNKEEYIKYFEWTKLYKKDPNKEILDDLACSLCEIAHKKKAGFGKIIPDIHKWWGDKKCRKGFAENFLKNITQPALTFESYENTAVL